MKIVATAVCCLALAGVARTECVEVQPNPVESSPQVQVRIVQSGKALKGVRVDFYQAGSQTRLSVTTNENGIAAPPQLLVGDYNVVATMDDVKTSLSLRVVHKRETTTLSMDMTPSLAEARQTLQAAEGLPIRNRVQEFQGTIFDESGAVVSGGNIKVVTKGSDQETVVARTKSDAEGHFSAQLDDGRYIAYFFVSGFRSAIIPFEVAKDGSGDMRITLRVGSC